MSAPVSNNNAVTSAAAERIEMALREAAGPLEQGALVDEAMSEIVRAHPNLGLRDIYLALGRGFGRFEVNAMQMTLPTPEQARPGPENCPASANLRFLVLPLWPALVDPKIAPLVWGALYVAACTAGNTTARPAHCFVCRQGWSVDLRWDVTPAGVLVIGGATGAAPSIELICSTCSQHGRANDAIRAAIESEFDIDSGGLEPLLTEGPV